MTPGCPEHGEQLAPYVDGELDPAAAEAFSLHLAGCEACRGGLHDVLQLVAVEEHAASAAAGASTAASSADGERRLAASDGNGERRAADSDGDGERRAAGGDGGRPSDDGGRPSDDGGRPSDDGGRPSVDGGRPSVDGGGPSVDGGGPSVDGGRPSVDGGRPSVDGGRPSVDGGRPSVDGDGARRSVNDEPRSPGVDRHSTDGAQRDRARERVRRWNRRARLAGIVAAAIAVLVAVRWIRNPRPPAEREAPVVLATADIRSLEARVSYAAADRHRPYRVARAATVEPADRIGLDRLAELERRGDLHGVAAGYLLLGDEMRASTYLERAAANPDVVADRALVILLAGRPADAIVALDGVLATAPRHPQALWNRALALRDLGLARMAVEAFNAVAALGEPGWADEARARGKALADQTDARQHLAEQLLAAGPKLATAPGAISADLARQMPGLVRLYFYDAVRGAATADAVRALGPLAHTLDAVSGGTALADYLARTARADFARRGPLAARYAEVVAGQSLGADAARDFLAALRAAHQDDILLGAMILTSPDRRTVPTDLLAEFRRLAEASGDAWFHLLAVEQDASAQISAGDFAAAEASAAPALARCASSHLEFRCIRLAAVLGESYLAMLRLSDARRLLGDGITRARRAGEWLLEQRFLPQLADLEMQSDDVTASTLPLARAYLDELMRRDPRCATEVWSRRELATMLLNREDIAGTRDELARAAKVAAGCATARSFFSELFVIAQVARDDEIPALRSEIAAQRGVSTTTPDDRAALDMIEGALILARERAAGTALLERSIAATTPRAARSVDAHKARSYAYSSLVFDAARNAEWPRVWQLLSDEAGVTVQRCALGVAIAHHRSVVVARDPAGTITGAYEPARAALDIDASHVVPTALREPLHSCEEIAVLARPPTQGAPGLLPIEVAWSYRFAGAAPGESRGQRRRLVVSNVEPPPELGLSKLLPWRSTERPDVALEGPAATPSRVLGELGTATVIEIHAHGLVNTAVSDASFVMLSPDGDGRFALTAAEVRQQRLRGQPIVILGACHAGATASYWHEPWGLPAAFVAAGARAVIASPDLIADSDAGAFFDVLRARIERGASPAQALRDQRVEWLAAHPDAAWVRSLMVFQ